MNGVTGRGSASTPRRLRAPATRQIARGWALPLTRTASSCSNSNRVLVARQVGSPTTTPPGGAMPWRREAVLTTSPTTVSVWRSGPSLTSASPVLTPIRTDRASAGVASFSSAMASSMRRAQRTARSGSSSCATGAPNTAITASPMNLSSVPPSRSISPRSRTW
jgi:hypothetical protein